MILSARPRPHLRQIHLTSILSVRDSPSRENAVINNRHIELLDVERAALERAGWYPSRVVSTEPWREFCQAHGFPMPAAACDFMRELGELVTVRGGNVMWNFKFDAGQSRDIDDFICRHGPWEWIVPAAPVGTTSDGRMLVLVDEAGRMLIVREGEGLGHELVVAGETGIHGLNGNQWIPAARYLAGERFHR
jgi:hypothetical protein